MGGNQELVKDVWYKIFSLNDTFLSWVKGQYIIVLHLCKKYLTFFLQISQVDIDFSWSNTLCESALQPYPVLKTDFLTVQGMPHVSGFLITTMLDESRSRI